MAQRVAGFLDRQVQHLAVGGQNAGAPDARDHAGESGSISRDERDADTDALYVRRMIDQAFARP